MVDEDFGELLASGSFNAGLAWGFVGLFVVSVVQSLITGEFLWAFFAGLAVVIVVTPAIALRNPWAMPPWEIVLVGSLPMLGRSLATLPATSDVAAYLSVAALALLLAVDLHLFTSVRMSVGFAVLFVVIGTLAAAAIWAVGRWVSDLYLGTGLLLDPTLTRDEIEHKLMLEFVASAIAGLGAGVVFEAYVRRRMNVTERIADTGRGDPS